MHAVDVSGLLMLTSSTILFHTHTPDVCTGWLQGYQQPTLSVPESLARGDKYG